MAELNELPDLAPYANLISHQLRTILALILKYICKNTLNVEIPTDKQDLRPLLNFTIDQCIQLKEKRLADNLAELRDSKYKDIVDDVIHDDHTMVNSRIAENMMTHIKHILSLAYR